MTPAIGYKQGLRGAQMFKRRVDQLFEIIDDARPDEHFRGAQNKQLFPMDLSRFKRIDATHYFDLTDGEQLMHEGCSLEDGRPTMWPIRYGYIVGRRGEGDDSWGEDSFQCHIVTSVNAKALRGLSRLYSTHMARYDAVVFHKRGDIWRFVSNNTAISLIGRRWINASTNGSAHDGWGVDGRELPPRDRKGNQDEVRAVGDRMDFAMTGALTARTLGYVEIGKKGGISFDFATLPGKVSAIFKARDLPDGESRRSALKGWVTDHWRQDINDPELEIYVRKHLRGAETFTWGDYFCTVHPAPIDIEEAERAKNERVLMGEQAKRRKSIEKPRVRVPWVTRPI